ncbi:hypothetical protein Tco_0544500, partial [Tanacetum coccineum]
RMVKVIAERRRQFETQRFIEKTNKPMTYAQQKNFMRTYVNNQSSVIYSTGWTLKHVKSLTDATLQEHSDDDFDDSARDTNPHYWHAFAAWEIVPTGLGDVNALY